MLNLPRCLTTVIYVVKSVINIASRVINDCIKICHCLKHLFSKAFIWTAIILTAFKSVTLSKPVCYVKNRYKTYLYIDISCQPIRILNYGKIIGCYDRR